MDTDIKAWATMFLHCMDSVEVKTKWQITIVCLCRCHGATISAAVESDKLIKFLFAIFFNLCKLDIMW